MLKQQEVQQQQQQQQQQQRSSQQHRSQRSKSATKTDAQPSVRSRQPPVIGSVSSPLQQQQPSSSGAGNGDEVQSQLATMCSSLLRNEQTLLQMLQNQMQHQTASREGKLTNAVYPIGKIAKKTV